MALHLEGTDIFKPILSGSPKDIEKFTDLLDVVIVAKPERSKLYSRVAGWYFIHDELPASMLANYSR